jgi:hypothetical protein
MAGVADDARQERAALSLIMKITLRRTVFPDASAGRTVTGRELWRWTQSGLRAPAHGPIGGVAHSLDEAKAAFRAAWDACENPIACMTFLSQFCPAPRASKRGAFEPRQNPPKSDAGVFDSDRRRGGKVSKTDTISPALVGVVERINTTVMQVSLT